MNVKCVALDPVQNEDFLPQVGIIGQINSSPTANLKRSELVCRVVAGEESVAWCCQARMDPYVVWPCENIHIVSSDQQ